MFFIFKEYREFIYSDQSPNSAVVVLKKLAGSIFFALLYLKVAPFYKIEYLLGILLIKIKLIFVFVNGCLIIFRCFKFVFQGRNILSGHHL